jgi:hypothetical protein
MRRTSKAYCIGGTIGSMAAAACMLSEGHLHSKDTFK